MTYLFLVEYHSISVTVKCFLFKLLTLNLNHLLLVHCAKGGDCTVKSDNVIGKIPK